MTKAGPGNAVSIRAYVSSDRVSVVGLFTRVNRELAPPDMRERFEAYIAASISGELSRIPDIFSDSKRNAFWVVETGAEIIGMLGIESRGEQITELRRMYLDRAHRGRGLAQRMLLCAETRARDLCLRVGQARGFSIA